jgi:hypothetical protein
MMLAADARFGITMGREQGLLLMEALAERPFRSVFKLIGRLHAWATDAFAHAGAAAQAAQAPFTLTHAELILVIDALGELPHRRVHVLVGSLQRQLEHHLRHG